MEHRDQLILKRLGRNLAMARAGAGLTQEQVANSMGVQTTHYARMEQGKHDTGITSYLKAMWAMESPPSTLFHKLEDRMP